MPPLLLELRDIVKIIIYSQQYRQTVIAKVMNSCGNYSYDEVLTHFIHCYSLTQSPD